MAVQITYFVHGTTTDNELNISSGWYDVELSELGRKQALGLSEITKDNVFAAVYCSDLKRAVESANLAFKNRFPIFIDKRLRECNYGIYNAKHSAIVEPLQEQNIYKRFPEGESYEDVKARIEDFLKSLKNDFDGKHIAIVAHKAPQLAFDVILKKQSWQQAFENDWRKQKAWKPGWVYILK